MISEPDDLAGLKDEFFADYAKAFPDWFDIKGRPARVRKLQEDLAKSNSVDEIRRLLNLHVLIEICEEYVPFVDSTALADYVVPCKKFLQPLKTNLKSAASDTERHALIARTGEELQAHFRDLSPHRYNSLQLEKLSPAIVNYTGKIKFTESGFGLGLLRDSTDSDCAQIMEVLARESELFAGSFVRAAEHLLSRLKTSKRIYDPEELTAMPAPKFDIFLEIARSSLQVMKTYPVDDLAQEIVYRLFHALEEASRAATGQGMDPIDASSLLLKFKRAAVCAVYFNGVLRLLGRLAREGADDDQRKRLVFVVQAFGVGLANAAANGHRHIGESSSYVDKLRCSSWPSRFVSQLDRELVHFESYLDDTIEAIESRRY